MPTAKERKGMKTAFKAIRRSPMDTVRQKAQEQGYEAGYAAAKREQDATRREAEITAERRRAYTAMANACSQAINSLAAALDNFAKL